MPAHISVLYPRAATFNMEYYLATHMPLVKKSWAQYGLKKYTVTQYVLLPHHLFPFFLFP